MAQVTQLRATGLPGVVQGFLAKTEAEVSAATTYGGQWRLPARGRVWNLPQRDKTWRLPRP